MPYADHRFWRIFSFKASEKGLVVYLDFAPMQNPKLSGKQELHFYVGSEKAKEMLEFVESKGTVSGAEMEHNLVMQGTS